MTKYMFLGLLWISFNINIPIGYGTLGLLPDFVGYYLLWKAMDGYAGGKRAASAAQKLMVFSAVVYVLDFLSVTGRLLIVGTLLAVVADAGVCYMQYLTIAAITGKLMEDAEENPETHKYMEAWKKAWFLTVCGTAVKYVFLWIPFVNITAVWFSAVTEVLFVLAAFRLWKRAGGRTDTDGMDKIG